MRTTSEIERAHDLLTFLLMHRIGDLKQDGLHVLDGYQIRKLAAYTSVLCWTLGHSHNPAFGAVLQEVEAELRMRGLSYDPHTRSIFSIQ